MANVFEQFHQPSSQGSGNVFEQFHTPSEAKRPEGGLVASLKQTGGQMVKSAGQLAADVLPGVDRDNALTRTGQGIIDANPTAVRSLADVADSPWTATKEAVGNAAASIGGVVGARLLGQGITAAAPLAGPAAPLVAGIGQGISWLGPTAMAALPSYGGIREQQIAADPNHEGSLASKALAGAGAATVGLIENRFGPQEWALKALSQGGRDALAKQFAANSLAGAIGKGAVKGAAIEGAEELVQNPVEQLASYQDPTTAANLQDTAFGGVMGALGGGVLGGGAGGLSRMITPSQPQQEQSTQPPQPAIDPNAGPLSKAASMATQTPELNPLAFTPMQPTGPELETDAQTQERLRAAQFQADALPFEPSLSFEQEPQPVRATTQDGMPFERIGPEDYDTLNPIRVGEGELLDAERPAAGRTRAPDAIEGQAQRRIGVADDGQQGNQSPVRTLGERVQPAQGENAPTQALPPYFTDQKAEQSARKALPFATEQGAQKKAAELSKKRSEPFTVIPHPALADRFAVVPFRNLRTPNEQGQAAQLAARAQAGQPGTMPRVEQGAQQSAPDGLANGLQEEGRREEVAPKPKNLLQLVRKAGGVSMNRLSDVTGDNNPRRAGAVGVFTKNGMDLDGLAELLQQNGFMTESEVSDVGSGAERATELLRQAIAGERPTSLEDVDNELAKQEERKYRDRIRQRANEMGIRTAVRKFEDIEADVLAQEEQAALAPEDRSAYALDLAGYNEQTPAVKSFLDDAFDPFNEAAEGQSVESAMRALGFTEEEINAERQSGKGAQEAEEADARGTQGRAGGADARQADQGQGQQEGLTLDDFRKMASEKGIDADLALRGMGGVPDFSVFGDPAPADQSPSDRFRAEVERRKQEREGTQQEKERTEYPFGKVGNGEEDRFFRSRVRVLPAMRGDTAWEGEVGSVLNGGRLIDVKRDGQDYRVRIPGDRIEVLDRVDSREQQPNTPEQKAAQKPENNDRPNPGRYVQPRGDGSVQQQKALADRGGRIATLMQLNDAAGNPYSYDEIQGVADDRIDAVRDYLVERQRPTQQAQEQPKQAEQPSAPAAQEAQPESFPVNPELESLFESLDGTSTRKANKAKKAIQADPRADKINMVQDKFLDILQALEDSGAVKINCK